MGQPAVRLALVAVLLAAAAGDARAYEFDVRARTIAQIYDRTWFRIGPNPVLGRRRFTELLTLDIWDLGGKRKHLRRYQPERRRGPNIYFTGHLRIDHDFGTWTDGTIAYASTSGFFCGQTCDAIDIVPELQNGALAVDLLYGYLAIDDLFDGRVDLRFGRHLQIDTLDWWSFDGASVRVDTPLHVAVEANGGVAVRESSPFGSPTFELDGTSGGQCLEYNERAGFPGEGAWQLPFRDVSATPGRFSADLDDDWCPQRDKLMPTWGGAAETSGLGPFSARVSYRRTMSRTVGSVHFGDAGWYPNEFGPGGAPSDTAPDWGVNHEAVGGSARVQLSLGRLQVGPHVEGRYSLLHGRVDQAAAGTRVTWRGHSIEPMVYYSFPTFDGDSIFNVFSGKAFHDFRLHYDLAPARGRWRAFARGWVRALHNEDTGDVEEGSIVQPVAYASGGQLGAAWRFRADRVARVDLFQEAGYGGRRTGGMGALRWRLRPTLDLSARASAFSFDADLNENLNGLTYGGQLGATWLINIEGVAVHLWFEENTNDFDRSQWRAIGVVDFAFQPET
jgi:hypothetical protein